MDYRYVRKLTKSARHLAKVFHSNRDQILRHEPVEMCHSLLVAQYPARDLRSEFIQERDVVACQIDHDSVVEWDMSFLPPVRVLIHFGKMFLHEFSKRDIDSHGFGEDFSILLDEDDVGIVFHCFS